MIHGWASQMNWRGDIVSTFGLKQLASRAMLRFVLIFEVKVRRWKKLISKMNSIFGLSYCRRTGGFWIFLRWGNILDTTDSSGGFSWSACYGLDGQHPDKIVVLVLWSICRRILLMLSSMPVMCQRILNKGEARCKNGRIDHYPFSIWLVCVGYDIFTPLEKIFRVLCCLFVVLDDFVHTTRV